MKIYKKVLSLMITFLFVLSLIPTNFITPVLAAGTLKSPVVNSDGTVTFNYQGDGTETKVIVKGSWDSNWAPTQMTKGDNNVWSAKLTLNKGIYEYGICSWNPNTTDQTNGDWKADPLNKTLKGGSGNPLVVNGPVINKDGSVTFYYAGTGAETKVIVKGSWTTNWDPVAMDKDPIAPNVWSKTLKLNTGKYEYGICSWSPTTTDQTNGDWQGDPSNPNPAGGNPVVDIKPQNGLHAINVPSEIIQNTTQQITALSFNNGVDEVASGVTWSVSPNDIATIDGNGLLTVKALPSDQDEEYITITGTLDGVTVSQITSIVKKLETPGGREVVLVGDIQSALGAGSSWAPDNIKTRMKYQGNGVYQYSATVPAGNYQYKVAIGGSWDENYGANGVRTGANISLTVPTTEKVTFLYSDVTHKIVDTTTYVIATPKLSGTDVPDNTTLTDYGLTGVYGAKVTLTKGVHSDLVITDGDKTFKVDPITITDDSKDVTISYDAATGITFNDLTAGQMDESKIKFDSKDAEYKSAYGAVATNSKITFNIQTGKNDLEKVKLVLYTPDGVKVIDMAKNGTFDYDKNGDFDRWSVDYTPTKLGMYQYYFVLINGSNVKAYGDDDGYYGTGKVGSLGSVGKYDLNVYDQNFKTPDWMKNAVVYQIFPDRFFNGDETNDYLQKLSRGNLPYEFISDWYSIPEDPQIEFNKDGTVSSTYTANKGDGQWSNDVYGGDLKGIQDKLDYLQSLGVNTLYLNPIASGSSNHRYDTKDYTSVDSLVGNMDDYVNLLKEAHKRGMHMILDGVFNHVSDDSIYFDRYGKYVQAGKPIGAYQYWSRVYDLMNANTGMSQQDAEKKVQATLIAQGITDFHYKDWFIIKNSKVKATNDNDAKLYGAEHYDYAGWNGNESLPEIQALNNSEYNVSSWANDVIDGPNAISKYWLNLGTDAWRLDAADSVSDDTWRHFRPVVKTINPDDLIVGEIWGDSSKYLLGDMFDSVMNYRFRGAIQGFTTGSSDAIQATKDLERMREQYPKEAFEALMNIMGSHDVERIISDFDGYGNNKAIAKDPSATAIAKMKLVPFLQMTYPGAPTIYYGDELGMPGAADPDNRRAMPWGKGNKELVEWYAKLTNIRNAYSVLRTGDIQPITVADDAAKDVMAYTRNDNTNNAVVVANRSTNAMSNLVLDVPSIANGTVLTNALNSTEKYTVTDGKVTVNVPAQLGIILVKNYKEVTVNYDALKPAYDSSYVVADRTTPKTDAAVQDDINKAAAGSNVQVSNTDELVSNEVLDTAKAKNVIPVIVRGDTSFTFADSKVLDEIHSAGLQGLQISVGGTLSNSDAVDQIIKANAGKLVKALKFDNNLPDGKFNGTVKVTSAVDASYKGKTVYVYYYNPATGKAELIASPVVDSNGNIQFDITHCSDYFVTADKLSVLEAPSNNGGSTGGTTSNTTTTTNASTTSATTLPKTGGVPMEDYALMGILVTLAGVIVVRKKN
ncbi:MAG: alpha-amylase family glycosyl hydrolase [Bacillota bacterium]|nr:alpha-amylase family glycosyl hydrolase [Bacillota bacterium]